MSSGTTGLWELFWLDTKLAQITVYFEGFSCYLFPPLCSFLIVSYNSSLLLAFLDLLFNLLLQICFWVRHPGLLQLHRNSVWTESDRGQRAPLGIKYLAFVAPLWTLQRHFSVFWIWMQIYIKHRDAVWNKLSLVCAHVCDIRSSPAPRCMYAQFSAPWWSYPQKVCCS